jgi:N6-adenosine-specific RNA methylase IME4
LRPEAVDQLAESIAARGLLQPIVVRPLDSRRFELVAGRHRLAAVVHLKEPSIRAVVLNGLDADSALLAEIDENLVRADLSPAERAIHLAERKRLYEKLHPETKHGGNQSGGGRFQPSRQNGDTADRFTKDAADKTGKSEWTLQREVMRAAKIPNLAEAIGTSLDTGDELDALAMLPVDVQRDLIERAKGGEAVTAKHVALKLRRDERELGLAQATEAASRRLGTKLYGVLYADPPWSFKVYNADSGLDGAADSHYPCMETADIAALPIPAASNAVLFLWSTVPHLPEALDVMRAWNFSYRSHFVWVKDRVGLGYWVRNSHELLLIGVRGNVPAPSPGNQFSSVIKAPRTQHSVKPDIAAEMIVRMFPNMPRLEMFARAARPGWDVWGNEVIEPANPPVAAGDGLDIPGFLRRTPEAAP